MAGWLGRSSRSGEHPKELVLNHPEKRVAAFFYGSFIRKDVLAVGGLQPERIEVAKLSGYDIDFDPHANVFRSEQHAIWGILVHASHQQLDRLYLRDGVGVFLPEAVLVETADRRLVPALCYMPPSRKHDAPDIPYVERILAAGREYGFPSWYLSKLENFLPRGAVPMAQR
jgi:hypothetical protein